MIVLANAIPLIFALVALVATLRWLREEADRVTSPEAGGAKRGVVFGFFGILLLAPIAIALAVDIGKDDTNLVVGIAMGVFISGIVPLVLMIAVCATQVMRHEDEEPVILSSESRRALRIPIIVGMLGGVAVGTLLIWLIARPPFPYDPGQMLPVAPVLAFLAMLWPFRRLKACAARDREAQAAAAAKSSPPPA